MSHGAAPSLTAAIVLTIVFGLGTLVAAPWIAKRWPGHVLAAAGEGCRQPTEFEQLHVVLAWRDGRLVQTGCMYVAPRGGYVRERRK